MKTLYCNKFCAVSYFFPLNFAGGGDNTLSAAVWNQVVMSLPSTSQFNVLRVYVSGPKDMQTEVDLLSKVSLRV